MPPVHRHVLHDRSEPGSTFSIIFSTFAVLVVLVCAVCFLIPRLRKRYPPKPSRTKFNDGSILYDSGMEILIPRSSSIPRARVTPATQPLRTYNPYTETPFQSNSAPDDAVSLPCLKQSIKTSPGFGTSSDGLFSPARDGFNTASQHTLTKTTVPKQLGPDAPRSHDFGDAKDFILAVPEPLALKARSAGQAPPTAKEIDRIPRSVSSPTRSDKHLHPNKLLQNQSSENGRISQCSSTTLRVDHRASDAVAYSDALVKLTRNAAEQEDSQQDASPRHVNNPPASRTSSNSTSIGGSETALHRLRSYHSLTGTPVGKPKLIRAGTLTRPKTPVEEIRKLYDRKPGMDNFPVVSRPLESSSSVPPFTRPDHSDGATASSPYTSSRMTESTLKLLPTPLRLKGCAGTSIVNSQTERWERNLSTSVTTPGHHDSLPGLPSDLKKKRTNRKSRGFYHISRKSRPIPLKLRIVNHDTSPPRSRRHSIASIRASMIAPLMKSSYLRRSLCGSSIYSRDTKGASVILTPVSPDFPTPIINILGNTVVNTLGIAPDSMSHSSLVDEGTAVQDGVGQEGKKDCQDETQAIDPSSSPLLSTSLALERALSDFGTVESSADSDEDHNEDINDDNTSSNSDQQICSSTTSAPQAHPDQATEAMLEIDSICPKLGVVTDTEDGPAPGGAEWI